MERIAYFDGRWMSAEEVRIPLDDRSLFFGDAVYDACIGRNGRIYDADAHLMRFYKNMTELRILPPVSYDSCMELLKTASTLLEGDCVFLYVQTSRTASRRTHAIPRPSPGRLLLTAERIPLPDPRKTIRLISRADQRYGFCHIKTVNLLPNVLASCDALACGAEEAVFVKDGLVTECAHSNISLLKDGSLITRPTDGCILPGVTRRRLLELCRLHGIPVVERPFSMEELRCADDVLITSSSKLCMRAEDIDGEALGRATKTAALLCRALFDDLIQTFEG